MEHGYASLVQISWGLVALIALCVAMSMVVCRMGGSRADETDFLLVGTCGACFYLGVLSTRMAMAGIIPSEYGMAMMVICTVMGFMPLYAVRRFRL